MNILKTTFSIIVPAFFFALLVSFKGYSTTHVTMSLKNITATANSIEYDLYIVNDGTTALKLSACSFGVNYNNQILNGGKLTYTYIKDSRQIELKNLSSYSLSVSKLDGSNQLKMTSISVKIEEAPELVQQVQYKIGRFKIMNTVAWTANSKPSFSLQEITKVGLTTTQIIGYVGNDTKPKALTPSSHNVTTKVDESPSLNETANGALPNHENNLLSKAGKKNIKIYPNPVNDLLRIDMLTDRPKDIIIKVLDSAGSVVKEVSKKSQTGMNQFVVYLKELHKGIFTIRIFENNEQTFTQRVNKLE